MFCRNLGDLHSGGEAGDGVNLGADAGGMVCSETFESDDQVIHATHAGPLYKDFAALYSLQVWVKKWGDEAFSGEDLVGEGEGEGGKACKGACYFGVGLQLERGSGSDMRRRIR